VSITLKIKRLIQNLTMKSMAYIVQATTAPRGAGKGPHGGTRTRDLPISNRALCSAEPRGDSRTLRPAESVSDPHSDPCPRRAATFKTPPWKCQEVLLRIRRIFAVCQCANLHTLPLSKFRLNRRLCATWRGMNRHPKGIPFYHWR
jgi:hypothetical protein